jgi:hypothetical protein
VTYNMKGDLLLFALIFAGFFSFLLSSSWIVFF